MTSLLQICSTEEIAESADRRRRHLWSGSFLATHAQADGVAMTCARLFLPPRQCSMIVDTGPDFPPGFRNQLESLGSEMIWFRPRENLTTRALNIYSGSVVGWDTLINFADEREGHQSFKYLSPGLQLHLHDLLLPPSPFADNPPKWVHIVCSVSRAQAMIQEQRFLQLDQCKEWSGKLVWEPMPVSSPSASRRLS